MDGRGGDRVLFDELYGKPTRISFDEPTSSSDGGLILLAGASRTRRAMPRPAPAPGGPATEANN